MRFLSFQVQALLRRILSFFHLPCFNLQCLMLKWTIVHLKSVIGWNFSRLKFLDTVVTIAIWLTWYRLLISCILHWRQCWIEIPIRIMQNLTSEFRAWLTHFSAFESYPWLCLSLSSMYISPTVPTPLTCTLQLTPCTFLLLQSLECDVPS
jgi:hypothetical protein